MEKKRIRKRNYLLFREIKTAEELKTRIVDGVLEVGNQYSKISHLLDKNSEGKSKVIVKYTHIYSGNHEIIRYI